MWGVAAFLGLYTVGRTALREVQVFALVLELIFIAARSMEVRSVFGAAAFGVALLSVIVLLFVLGEVH